MGAVVAVHHVRRHVQARQGKMHERGELVPPISHLPEALQVEDEDVRERPQAHLHHALLQLLTVGAFPGIIWGKLEGERVPRRKDGEIDTKMHLCLFTNLTEPQK